LELGHSEGVKPFLGNYYLSLRRLEEGQEAQTAPCDIFLAPVLVPDVEGDNEDNDDDGG
jgi:hypothetical protein